MRKLIYMIVLILLVIPAATTAQNFREAASETYPLFSDIFMLNENTGWTVGIAGRVFKTTDAGNKWNQITTGITDTLTAVFFLNENVGFIGAKNAKVLKTTNGGLAWQALNTPVYTGSVNSLYFSSDGQKGWALNTNSSKSQVLYSSDAGVTWSAVVENTGNLYDMSFAEAGKGVVVGGGSGKIDLYSTTDGASWKKSTAPALGGLPYSRTDVRGVTMVTKDIVYATGWGSFAAGLQPSMMLKSTDGGATWNLQIQTEANRTYDNMYSLKFKDELTGLAFGGSSRGAVVCKTTDGGVNWIQQMVPFGGGIKKVVGFGDKLFVIGDVGMVIKSTDFGNSWSIVSNLHAASYNSIYAIGQNTIIAGGNSSILAKSTDKGINWKGSFLVAGKVAPNIQSLFFVNDNVGFSAQSNGVASKTTDAGNSWKVIIPDTMSSVVNNNDVFFVNENLGFIVGAAGSNIDRIYKTTDGGATWSSQIGQISRTLRTVAFANENNGVAIGSVLKALYTTNGGTSWTPSVFKGLTDSTVSDFKKARFLDATTAIVIGDKKIFKSTDAGATWYNVTPSPFLVTLNDLFVGKDGKTAWASGYRNYGAFNYTNYIFNTTDAGNTWTNIVDTTSLPADGPMTSLTRDNAGNFWLGSSGSIYTNAPLVSVRENGNVVPVNYSLSQNYPNPFNPSTTIAFNIGQTGKVSLKVFDILGREVSALINKEMVPGAYTVDFNTPLSSGVYFYTLKAGEFSSTKKMVILK